MLHLTVSAPGKVILFGEHSAVYNKKVIATSLSLRTTLTFSQTQQSQGVSLDFPDAGLYLEISPSDIVRLLEWDSTQVRDLKEVLPLNIESFLDSRSVDSDKRAAAIAFLTLYCLICTSSTYSGSNTYGRYIIQSDLPIGAGLGSSATVCVVVSAVLLILNGLIQRPTMQDSSPRSADLQLINDWAYTGESCLIDNPSGVDNTVATYGGGVAYQKNLAGSIQVLEIPSLPLLLTHTTVPKSTKTQVAKVRSLKESLPLVVTPLLEAMHQIAIEAETLLTSSSLDLERLGQLVVLNQGLLRTLGVSHPSIEQVIEHNQDIGWTKLVGAGGGGCTITLLKPAQLQHLEAGPSNMVQYKVELGGPGVGIHGQDGSIIYFGGNKLATKK